MSNLKILIKNNIDMLLSAFQGKKKRKSTSTAVALLVLIGIGLIALYSLQTWSMFNGLGNIGLQKLVLFHGIITTLTVMIVLGVMRVTGEQKHTDDDLLMSLPIKKSDIIISKSISKYLFDLFFAFVLLAPFIVMYEIYTKFSLTVTIMGIILILLFPLLSVGLSYICDFIVTRLFNRLKGSKFYKSMFAMIIFITTMSLMMIKTFGYGNVQTSSMEEYFSDRPISNTILNFITSPKFLNIIIVLLITIFVFAIGVILYSINYGKTFEKFRSSKTEISFNQSSPFKTLYLKEIKRYFTTPAYFVNTIIGAIIPIILSVAIIIAGKEKVMGLFMGTLNGETILGLLALLLLGTMSLTNISSPAISLESHNLWIIKVLPIDEKHVFLSKSLLHLTIAIPSITITSILLAIALPEFIIEILIIFGLATTLSGILAFGGLFINIIFPMLNWTDETRVVKAGLSTLLGMMLGFLLTLLPLGLFYLFKNLPLVAIGLITLAVYILILGLSIWLLFSKGKKLFRKL
ncbi:MAG: hypothetical protein E7345_05470 [Clostridiales bacterium]|nr:hypothetical protein [Clostridiales bacterium]